ncbi:autotransporter assembly complex protein TamA [Sphingomonas sp. PR090111-T3T-6A]|uniref:autotransporter assembly complex protein TamA n=1 Tax=Sphingomonas sp. PR090111-T3T-6A TaxID=685778 RepID=UPI000377F105|nr:BamA/TamA family outer membrane protein [Sphingomonas sp. PR090111-T3T-6A]
MSPAASRRRARSACAAIVLVACPVAAHGQDAPTTAGAPQALPDNTLDPHSPMAAMPDLGVDWPDLAKPDAPLGMLPPDETSPGAPTLFLPPPTLPDAAAKPASKPATSKTTETTGDRRYVLSIEGLGDVAAEGLVERFDALSSLHQGEGAVANVAQIDRRAREDADLLRELLRAYGYYDAEVDARVGGTAGPTLSGQPRLAVTLSVTAGPSYRFRSVALPGLAAAGRDEVALAHAFGVKTGDPVNADKVTGGIEALKLALGQHGYAFATVAEPDITVDHDTHEATLSLAVEPGKVMRFGAYRLSGKRVFGMRHLMRISRMKPGDRYDATRLDDLRRALIQTGLVSVVQLTPVRTADPEVVDVDARLEPAPPRTIAGTLGYGTGEGASIEISWQHRNLLPPEGAVTFRGLLGTQEQLLSAQLRRGNFRDRDQVLTGQVAIDHQNRPAYDAKTLTLAAGMERQTNIIWQKKWTWSYGGELIGSDERDVIAATGQPRRRTYFITAAPLSLAYDGTDDLLNPSTGWRLSAHVSPEVSLQGSPFTYVRIQLDGSAYQPVGDHLVFAGRLRFGSIQGASADRIAPTRRFYSGGGGSVRGFGYQKIGPRDIDNDPVGGASLAEFGLEARIRFGNFGLVPFFDGGNLYEQSLPRFTGFRYGTGLGFRYYTSFGPVRVDVGTPINPLPGDSRVAVYVSLGQAF